MPEFRYGPVEFYLVGFQGDRPSQATVDALLEVLASGMMRLLDIVFITKAEDGTVSVTEVEEAEAAAALADLDIVASGLAGEEDINDFAEVIPEGTSAALVAVELVYQRKLASALANSGSTVLSTERVPAPIVNAVLDLVDATPEGA